MVAPLLALGILGAGYAGKGLLDDWQEGRSEKRRGQKFQDTLGGLGEDASPLDMTRALAGSGLIGADTFAQQAYGANENILDRDFRQAQQEDAQANQWGLLRAGQDFDLRLAGAQGQQAQEAARIGAFADLTNVYQPQLDAIDAKVGQIDELNGLLGEYATGGMFDGVPLAGTQDGQVLASQIAQLEEEQFQDWMRETYGDREAPPETQERLRETFYAATGGSLTSLATEGRIERVIDLNNRRAARYRGKSDKLQSQFDRDAARIWDPTIGPEQGMETSQGQRPDSPPPEGFIVSKSGRDYDPSKLLGSESGGRFDIGVNSEGYGGRMQIGDARLADAAKAGLVPEGMTGADFARLPPAEQQRVEQWHFSELATRAERKFGQVEGQTIGGVPITLEGMVNAMHLAGEGGLRAFIQSGGREDRADSNGTRVSDYLAMGAG